MHATSSTGSAHMCSDLRQPQRPRATPSAPRSPCTRPSLRANLTTVLHCAAWLRLLVTALLCVVGVARPVAQMSEAEAAKRANGPIEVSASTREGDLTALRKRIGNETGDDEASLVDAPPDCIAASLGCIDVGTSDDARLTSTLVERPRARGPPLA